MQPEFYFLHFFYVRIMASTLLALFVKTTSVDTVLSNKEFAYLLIIVNLFHQMGHFFYAIFFLILDIFY